MMIGGIIVFVSISRINRGKLTDEKKKYYKV